ncbi:sulfotransferase 1A2-like [Pecten maximus]|uniref:sulfotransferase 1A2-like n=1 Tax=Pecten maximus TaxID=6579 RepID=UPI0014585B6C|nr:sulfotransferase 1A2-like [Pecten maximus]
MDFVSITDESNNKYSYKRYNDYAFIKEVVGNVGDHLQDISQLQCKTDDVLIGVFPKSGTHWLYNTVMMLRTGSLDYHGTPILMEYQDINIIDNMISPRTFGSHLRFRFLPQEMRHGKGKVITIIRDPKDIVVSLYHMLHCIGDVGYSGTFDGLLKRFFSEECFWGNGSWFAWMKDVEEWKSSNLLCVSYKDFKENPYETIMKLATFLEVDHDEKFLRAVEKNVQFGVLKESHNNETPASDRWKEITEDGRLPIYRKGQIGDWKNTFTVFQKEWYDKICKEKTTEFGLALDVNFGEPENIPEKS